MRLIDADALGELVSHGVVHYEDIMAQPTVDAVPVIRCRDCARNENCFMYRESGDDNGYCAWAVKRDK